MIKIVRFFKSNDANLHYQLSFLNSKLFLMLLILKKKNKLILKFKVNLKITFFLKN